MNLIEGASVLVTGGAGFIGSNLAEVLVPSNEVHVIDDLSSGKRTNVPDDALLHVGDVRKPETFEAVPAVDHVFHQAAMVDVPGSIDQPRLVHEVNASGTVTVLEYARSVDAGVVYASSAAVYGHPTELPIPESEPCDPLTPYGLSKLSGEQYVRLYRDLYDLDAIALRYFNVYGPRQGASNYSTVIPTFLELASDGNPLVVHGDGTQTRDFVHVDDVIEANLLAATRSPTEVVFNVGTGETTSINDLAELVHGITESGATIEHGPPRDGDIKHSQADLTATSSALDYEPSVALDEGLERLLGEYQ